MAPTNTKNHSDQASTNYKEAFSLFDRRGSGRVSGELLGDLLRACGQNPTLAEIADLEKSVGNDCRSLSPLGGSGKVGYVLMMGQLISIPSSKSSIALAGSASPVIRRSTVVDSRCLTRI